MIERTQMISKRKKHSDKIENIRVEDAREHGVSYRVFSNVECNHVVISRSADGFRFHNSDRKPDIAVDGRKYNLVLRDCETIDVRGDGLYVTKVDGVLVENCKFGPPSESSGDCVQFAYEKDERNRSRNILIRGCILQQADRGSKKGALIFERSTRYSIENCWLEGNNFSVASTGDECVARSNRMGDSRLNDYSFGYGVSERHHVRDHHVYDNVITNCRRGISLSGFGDRDVAENGVVGYQRADVVIHDNIISECQIGFFADRAWSGAVYRNVYVNCDRASLIRAFGRQVANRGAAQHQIVGPIYTNDGSFRCEEVPRISLDKGAASVSPGRWSHAPDDIRYVWRIDGIDVPMESRPLFHQQKDGEISCVVLARKGNNWMLSIAERSWADPRAKDGPPVPRSVAEGRVTWGYRYV